MLDLHIDVLSYKDIAAHFYRQAFINKTKKEKKRKNTGTKHGNTVYCMFSRVQQQTPVRNGKIKKKGYRM